MNKVHISTIHNLDRIPFDIRLYIVGIRYNHHKIHILHQKIHHTIRMHIYLIYENIHYYIENKYQIYKFDNYHNHRIQNHILNNFDIIVLML